LIAVLAGYFESDYWRRCHVDELAVLAQMRVLDGLGGSWYDIAGDMWPLGPRKWLGFPQRGQSTEFYLE
jgi:hypothetical protein